MEVTTVTRLVYVRGVAEVGEPVLVVGAVLPGGALLATLTTPGPGSSTGQQQEQEQRQETLHISFTTSLQESQLITITATATQLVVMNNINIG